VLAFFAQCRVGEELFADCLSGGHKTNHQSNSETNTCFESCAVSDFDIFIVLCRFFYCYFTYNKGKSFFVSFYFLSD
jgi:hypothetical protein